MGKTIKANATTIRVDPKRPKEVLLVDSANRYRRVHCPQCGEEMSRLGETESSYVCDCALMWKVTFTAATIDNAPEAWVIREVEQLPFKVYGR